VAAGFDKCPDEKGIKHTRWRKKLRSFSPSTNALMKKGLSMPTQRIYPLLADLRQMP